MIEQIWMPLLRAKVASYLDPLLFAYHPKTGVEDVLLDLLHRAPGEAWLCGDNNVLWLLQCFPYHTTPTSGPKAKRHSCQPTHNQMDCDLTNRPRFIRLNQAVLDRICTNMGAPARDGPVTFPVYPLHNFFTHNTELMTAIVSCVTRWDNTHHRETTESFVKWCEANYLNLNLLKTKEQVVDLGGFFFPIKFVLMVKTLVLLTFRRSWV